VKRRIARDRRRSGVRVLLGARDEALLRALARFRIARTEDLARLFFRDIRRDTASSRLRKLHDAGFIEVRSTGLNEPNVYALGPEGRSWAEDRGVSVGTPPAPPFAHHLMIVRLWASLAATLSGDGALRLQRFEPDWELRARLAGSGAPVVPDAAIEIGPRGRPSGPVARIALEVDLTTERPAALRRKLTAYDVSRCFDGSQPVTLAVVLFGARERRVAALRSLIEAEWRGPGRVFSESDWPEALLSVISEAPQTGTPSGKGMVVPATCDAATASHRQGEGLSPSLSRLSDRGNGD
jgi:protein involved in plasmid replication-relaxation